MLFSLKNGAKIFAINIARINATLVTINVGRIISVGFSAFAASQIAMTLAGIN